MKRYVLRSSPLQRLAGLAILWGMHTAPLAAELAKAAPLKTFKVGLWQAPAEPSHPFLIVGEDATYLEYLFHIPLLSLDAERKWQCRLCGALPEVLSQPTKGSAAPLQLAITLNRNLRWGDGTPITGEDLRLSWELAQQVCAKASPACIYQSIDKVEMDPKDPARVVLTFNGRQFTYSHLAELLLVPSHIEGPRWQESNGDVKRYLELTAYRTAPATAGLYSGPFIVTSDHRPRGMTVIANPHYQPGAELGKLGISLDVVFLKGERTPPRDLSLVSEIACRHLDCRHSSLPLSVQRGDSLDFEHVDFNLSNPWLRSEATRHALSLAIDQRSLMQALLPMEATEASSFRHPTSASLRPPVRASGYDPQKAADLLDREGWKRDPRSGMRFKADKKFELDLVTNDTPLRRTIAQYLGNQWKNLGVTINLRLLSDAQFRDQVLRRRNFTSMVLYAWRLPIDGSYGPLFHSKAIPRGKNRFQGQNLSGWYARRVDALLDTLDAQPFLAAKEATLGELEELYAAQKPGIPLFFHESVVLRTKELEGVRIPGTQEPSSVSAASWRIRQN